nr:MAG TPA_asm: hypothetical protein [Caudoviricetes sp.]DAV14600.1 MAG TPA: hypothetical protein [Bacteriophage sp.]
MIKLKCLIRRKNSSRIATNSPILRASIKADRTPDATTATKTSIRAESLPHLYHRPNLS